MWRYGAWVFLLYAVALLILNASSIRSVSKKSAWVQALNAWTWSGVLTWVVRAEPKALDWLILTGIVLANTGLVFVQTYRGIRWGKFLDALMVLTLLFLTPMAWGMIYFWWPFLDGAGLFLGLVLPFSTDHFRDVTQGFWVAMLVNALLALVVLLRASKKIQRITPAQTPPTTPLPTQPPQSQAP